MKQRVLIEQTRRYFPRAIHREQKLRQESDYNIKGTIDKEGATELKRAKTRKDYELLKDGDRLYRKFNIDQSAMDLEYEKELDQLIDEKISQGYDDQRIL